MCVYVVLPLWNSSLIWFRFLRSIPQGAATTIYCATDPEALADAGKYFQDCAVHEDLALCRDEKAR